MGHDFEVSAFRRAPLPLRLPLPVARATDRPNILFLYLDDLGWRDTGFMGSDFYETPHLDALAAEGLGFTDAYSCAANCAPARACLLATSSGTRCSGRARAA